MAKDERIMVNEGINAKGERGGNRERPVRKILACRTDRFGEFLLTVPALRALQKAHPGAVLYIVCDPSLSGLARLLLGRDGRIIPFANRRHSLLEILFFSLRLRREKFDTCLIFNPTKELHIAAFLAAIPRRFGYARKWDFLLTGSIRDTRDLGLKHEKQSNLELACLSGACEAGDSDHRLYTDENIDALLPGAFLKEGFIVLHPWTSDGVKQWPHDRFLRLARLVSGELGVNLAMIGGEEESRIYPEFYSGLEGRNIVNLTGKTTLPQLLKLLSLSRLLVSGDSGPMHLAAAAGTRVAALFRNDTAGKTPRRWGPLGPGHIVFEKTSLSEISVEEVFEAVKGMLDAQSTFH